MTASAASRPYRSPLRDEQAEQTRDRIVRAAVDLLSEGGADDVSMRDVAERAGVAVRTVYRSFATRDDLLDGVIAWINDEIEARVGPQPTTFDEYVGAAPRVMEVLFDIEPLYRALFATEAGRASHRRSAAARREEVRGAFTAELAGLDDDEGRRFAAVVHLVTSSTGALFLKDYWGLSPEDVGRALGWAVVTLADAARDPKRREGL
jgi:AcrR family transcriptional regulator